MTCDEYFEYLTSDVPPDGGESPADHLAGCPRCRSLAEALEPALELFRAAAGESSAHHARPRDVEDEIPAWLLAEVDAVEPDRTADALCPRAIEMPSSTVKSRRNLTWPMLAATLIGILAGGAVWGVGSAGQRGLAHREAADQPALSAIQLSPACLASSDAPSASPPASVLQLSAMVESERNRLNCCTSCHAIGRVAAAACDARLLAVSCQACHAR